MSPNPKKIQKRKTLADMADPPDAGAGPLDAGTGTATAASDGKICRAVTFLLVYIAPLLFISSRLLWQLQPNAPGVKVFTSQTANPRDPA